MIDPLQRLGQAYCVDAGRGVASEWASSQAKVSDRGSETFWQAGNENQNRAESGVAIACESVGGLVGASFHGESDAVSDSDQHGVAVLGHWLRSRDDE